MYISLFRRSETKVQLEELKVSDLKDKHILHRNMPTLQLGNKTTRSYGHTGMRTYGYTVIRVYGHTGIWSLVKR